jgi:hypothetical protein
MAASSSPGDHHDEQIVFSQSSTKIPSPLCLEGENVLGHLYISRQESWVGLHHQPGDSTHLRMVDIHNPIVIRDEACAYPLQPTSVTSQPHRTSPLTVAYVKLCHVLGGLYM